MFSYPVTAHEFERFLKYEGENHRIFEFFKDVADYARTYHQFQKFSQISSTSNDTATVKSFEECVDECADFGAAAQQQPQAKKKHQIIGKSSSTIKEPSAIRDSAISNGQNEVGRTSKLLHSNSHQQLLDDATSFAEAHSLMGFHPLKSSLLPEIESQLCPTLSSASVNHAISVELMESSARIFEKYISADASDPLTILSDGELELVLERNRLAKSIASERQLNFIQSAQFAFNPLVKRIRTRLACKSGLYPRFLRSCIENVVQSAVATSPYTHSAIQSFNMKIIAVSMGSAVILLASLLAYFKMPRVYYAVVELPLFFMCGSILLSQIGMSLSLYWQGMRESVLFSNELGVKVNVGATVEVAKKHPVAVQLVPIVDDEIFILQDQLLVRNTLYALISSLLLTSCVLLLIPVWLRCNLFFS